MTYIVFFLIKPFNELSVWIDMVQNTFVVKCNDPSLNHSLLKGDSWSSQHNRHTVLSLICIGVRKLEIEKTIDWSENN